MNTVKLRHGKDTAVTIEISDEACRAYQRCKDLTEQERYEDIDCAHCPLDLKIGELSLCVTNSVSEMIETRLNEMDENRTGGEAR